jgi:hypothetical protein
MESIIHGIKPEPSKQSLVNEREQSMKEPKRKDKHKSKRKINERTTTYKRTKTADSDAEKK